ncbi:MAG: hypothetical protein CO186_08025 [Zetaproteobacteria bacterium CG_4_9_14_3_um_filter_49_83]|nr:MAG: hypothetical protein COW62_03315 [Zetaproteobacteria bacterium CG17_big_fil_post_rev_8_21_14_2_50_50_13]PIV30237.1 MAG: hypothetical protein COS35_07810 [Zetaproteobacteria bacterium CG02_land_8_20_14_3_00_50_9]PIY55866.1 MAG: hypothetical protein COZ00_07025 [Zetaproteobacteria bacterium CG_4_10_14_0_8_um_filter_49_80]PJA34996.1 MAG: hypothetical protein CO186_08025 [Zetaproteobacteria bacterium CG_4_9_14_3_um_filter_49_83]
MHYDFLFSLLSFHPEAEEKIGCGISSFKVRSVPGYEHIMAFWAISNDGSEIEICYPTCPFRCFDLQSEKDY